MQILTNNYNYKRDNHMKSILNQLLKSTAETVKSDITEKRKTYTEAKEFSDSADATDYMEKIESMLKSAELKAWAKETDSNFSNVKTQKLLKIAEKAYSDFLEEMYSAE